MVQRWNGTIWRERVSRQTQPPLDLSTTKALSSPSRDLVGKHYALTHYSEDGAEVVTTPDHEVLFYYPITNPNPETSQPACVCVRLQDSGIIDATWSYQ